MKLETAKNTKIINDPVYGLINIPEGLIFNIIEHTYFQRLRRIKQLGFTEYVYPGATHNRFQHAIGAAHLMSSAIESIRTKGPVISEEEKEASIIAILLHDIGHGPFSHTLELNIIDISHENLSLMFMNKLNDEFNGKLDLAIKIFTNKYKKKFLHQLVSSQLDVDRLDYLRRDSFYTGVSEGVIGSDRIIKMLNVVNDNLVVEAKGIYSIEKFLIARSLMYWQVYLHKTVISSEQLLTKIFDRAKYLCAKGENLFIAPALKYFLHNDFKQKPSRNEILNHFSLLDDNDITTSIKNWINSNDSILSQLCNNLINRHLYRIELRNKDFKNSIITDLKKKFLQQNNIKISEKDINYFIFKGQISNKTYSVNNDRIKILKKTGELVDINEASDMLNISALSTKVTKYFLCYPKFI